MSEQHNSTTTVEEEKQKLIGLWAAGIFTVLSSAFAGISIYAVVVVQQGRFQLEDALLMPTTIIVAVISLLSYLLIRRGRYQAGTELLFAIMMILPFIAVLLVDNFEMIAASYVAIFGPIMFAWVLPKAAKRRAVITIALAILAMVGIEIWNPGFRGTSTFAARAIPVVTALAAVALAGFLIRQAWGGSLRTKLLVSTLAITGLTIAVISFFAVYNSGQSQTFMIDQLQNAVRLQSRQQIKDTVFAATLDAEETLSEMVEEVEKLAQYHTTLYAQSSTLKQGAYWDANIKLRKLPGGQYDNPNSDIASVFIPSIVTLDEAMIANINTGIYLDFTVPTILQSNQHIVAVYFIGTDGTTIYYPNINLAEVVPPDFDPRLRPFYSIATPDKNPERKVVWTDPYQDAAGNGLLVTASTPVYDQAGKFRGVIAVDVQLIDISTNVSEIKVGESGFAFLVDSSGRLIGMPEAGYKFFNLSPEVVPVDETPKQTILEVQSIDLQEIFRKMTSGETGLEIITVQGEEYYVSYASLSSVDYSLGVVAPVAELDVPFLTARDQVQSNTRDSNRLFFIILIVMVLAAAGTSLLFSQFLSGPIVRLTNVAEQVAAGDLNAQARIESTDETGQLAGVFNRMTFQLREFIGTLESRVAERTQSLELATEVGRSVSQVRALDVMMKDAAELIRSRFDLYYTQIYLTNQAQNALILQAGTGKVGAELVNRGHQLLLNTNSINGRAVVEKRSVVISDTAASTTFRANPLLPETRSEMAVPLMIGEKVVGVLDLQSSKAGSLSQDILPAFEALAGQLAIAIQNANLLAEAEQARAEVEKQARNLTRTNWKEYLDAIHEPEHTGFIFKGNQITPLENTDESLHLVEEGTALSAPIAVSGEQLGTLVVELDAQNQSAQNTELIGIVARQVAQQIESLRLLGNAERYRFEAEQAARRTTIEGWKQYITSRNTGSLGYLYDSKEVRPYNEDQPMDETAFTLPIKAHEETVGKLSVLGLGSQDGEALELANAVVERLGDHIENLRLFEETKRGEIELDKRARQLAAVANISSVSSRELDIDKMLHSVVHLTQRQFGLYHAHVFIYDENTAELKIAACGYKEGDEHEGTDGTSVIPLAQEKSLVARSARTRQSVIVNDVRHEDGWLPNPLLPDTASELAVPLVIGDQILGVLDVQSDIINAFSEEDANIYATLASQVSTALQNAKSFSKSQQQAERESMLNTISQKIQSATTVEAVLQIAARELGHALGAPLTIAQLGMKDNNN